MQTNTYTWKMATPKEMVAWFQLKLNKTPRWRLLKRMQIRRYLNYWKLVETDELQSKERGNV